MLLKKRIIHGHRPVVSNFGKGGTSVVDRAFRQRRI
jgi:hypothetical protein